MLRSLRFQVLWPPAVVVLLGTLLFALEAHERSAAAERMRAVTQVRMQLDRAVARLAQRHDRTARRAREAVLEPLPANQIAILAWTSEHYLKEMERYLAAATAVIRTVAVPGADPRLGSDLAHLERQLERIHQRTQELAPALDGLLEAVSSGDPDALLTAQQDFDRNDKSVQAALSVAERMVQRASTWQGERAAAEAASVHWGLWLLLALLAPLSFWLAYRPLARVRRQALGHDTMPASDEERTLAQHMRELNRERDALDSQLVERTREAERAIQGIRRVEHELALLKLYNENLVNSLRSAVVVTDATGQVAGFNRAARSLLGFDTMLHETPIEEHRLFGALAGRSSDARADLERALSERQVLRFDGIPYPTAGREVLLDLTLAPYLDESGAARGLLWVLDDVTDAVHVKKQLLAAERLAAVGRLSAQVAHEVRNPLSAIGLNAELLEEEILASVEEGRRDEPLALLRAIASEIERLTQVTEGYLGLARLPRPEARDADLNQVVGDLVNMLGEELKGHGVEVVLDLATPAPHAWADPGQLRQALLNVVRNGREAMAHGGILRLLTRSDGATSWIEVSDTGPGIEQGVLPRVFEPFYTTKPEGTGLGLSLTQQIIAQHGGSIDVRSAEPGGTTIRLSLPWTDPSAAEAAEPAHERATIA